MKPIIKQTMNKYPAADDTLQELWDIKAETAKRYKTAADYFAHLGLARSAQAPSKPPAKRTPIRTVAVSRTTSRARSAVHL